MHLLTHKLFHRLSLNGILFNCLIHLPSLDSCFLPTVILCSSCLSLNPFSFFINEGGPQLDQPRDLSTGRGDCQSTIQQLQEEQSPFVVKLTSKLELKLNCSSWPMTQKTWLTPLSMLRYSWPVSVIPHWSVFLTREAIQLLPRFSSTDQRFTPEPPVLSYFAVSFLSIKSLH